MEEEQANLQEMRNEILKGGRFGLISWFTTSLTP